jgi:sec-independent protein translocase protein TatA
MYGLFAFLDLNPVTLMILGALAVLLFGDRLPEVARSVGKTLMEFKKGMRGIEQELHSAIYDSTTPTSTPASYTSPTTYQSQLGLDDREEATAPKFEPPPAATSLDTLPSNNSLSTSASASASAIETSTNLALSDKERGSDQKGPLS